MFPFHIPGIYFWCGRVLLRHYHLIVFTTVPWRVVGLTPPAGQLPVRFASLQFHGCYCNCLFVMVSFVIGFSFVMMTINSDTNKVHTVSWKAY